jgi:hypothetical protein
MHQIDSNVTTGTFWAKPYVNLLGISEHIPHPSNLDTPLSQILLIDANGVNPENAGLVFSS